MVFGHKPVDLLAKGFIEFRSHRALQVAKALQWPLGQAGGTGLIDQLPRQAARLARGSGDVVKTGDDLLFAVFHTEDAVDECGDHIGHLAEVIVKAEALRPALKGVQPALEPCPGQALPPLQPLRIAERTAQPRRRVADDGKAVIEGMRWKKSVQRHRIHVLRRRLAPPLARAPGVVGLVEKRQGAKSFGKGLLDRRAHAFRDMGKVEQAFGCAGDWHQSALPGVEPMPSRAFFSTRRSPRFSRSRMVKRRLSHVPLPGASRSSAPKSAGRIDPSVPSAAS